VCVTTTPKAGPIAGGIGTATGTRRRRLENMLQRRTWRAREKKRRAENAGWIEGAKEKDTGLGVYERKEKGREDGRDALPCNKEEPPSYKDFWPTETNGKFICDLYRSFSLSSFHLRLTSGRVFFLEDVAERCSLRFPRDQDPRYRVNSRSIMHAWPRARTRRQTDERFICYAATATYIAGSKLYVAAPLLALFAPPLSLSLSLSLSFSLVLSSLLLLSLFSRARFFCFLLVLFDRLARLLFIETTYRSMFHCIRRLVRLSVFSPA